MVKEGERAMLPCAAQAWPKGQYSWYRIPDSPFYLDSQLPLIVKGSTRDGRMIQIGGSLIVNHAMVNDSGKYRCEVKNSEGLDSYTTELTVLCKYLECQQSKLSRRKGDSSTFVSTLLAEYFPPVDKCKKVDLRCPKSDKTAQCIYCGDERICPELIDRSNINTFSRHKMVKIFRQPNILNPKRNNFNPKSKLSVDIKCAFNMASIINGKSCCRRVNAIDKCIFNYCTDILHVY